MSPLTDHALGNTGYVPTDTDIQLDAVFDPAAVTAPSNFGTTDLNWGMLGNDMVGDCLVASAAHEVMAEAHAAGRSPVFSTKYVLQSYSAWTGYVPGDESTDLGTDPVASAKNRRKEGVLDSNGHGHRIGAFVIDEDKNYSKILASTYAFTADTVCVSLPYSAEEAFNEAERTGEMPVWDYDPSSPIAGGHAIAGVAAIDGQLVCISWGKPVIVTAKFVQAYLQCIVYYISGSALKEGKNPVTGFDIEALRKELAKVRG